MIGGEIVWGHGKLQPLYLQIELLIPREVWISRVLPRVGYGVVHVLELPASTLEACASMQHAFKALQQAQELQASPAGKAWIAHEKKVYAGADQGAHSESGEEGVENDSPQADGAESRWGIGPT